MFFDILILDKDCFGFHLLSLFLILLTLMSSKFVYSDQTNFSISRRDRILASYFLDARNSFLVGAHGLLLHTVNGGESWQKIEVDTVVDPLNNT